VAYEWLPGAAVDRPDWRALLAAADALHDALRDVPWPPWLDGRTSWWATGARVAWGEEPPSVRVRDDPTLRAALARYVPLDLPRQVVHGDLAVNVLFADGLPPAVIDLSPYLRPRGWANAVAVADGYAFGHADADALDLLPREHREQLLLRAVVFRAVSHAERCADAGCGEHDAYAKVLARA
jgi:prepilin-type processing-associated H-X9-DG protein